VNAIWSFKGLERPPFSILVIFLWQKNLITLQMLQASAILSWVVAVSLTIFQLPPFQDTSPISTTNLLQTVGFEIEKYN
jgi:ABC-type phosphate/phosphonate transport system permease subunit